ncbi:hypothetical protein LCGC14_1098130 [marine sediment metagenome]|uniref:Uncharacterized protein n=1 Tax=marine sediment metagenome TaxID=412755 RepID=A0A0F9PTJ1_9ZZZZ|nr:hypothetical protein [bacterium]
MDTEKHNGWTNYATWRVALEVFDGYEHDEDYDLTAEYLQDYAETLILGESTADGFAYDYAYAFLSDVNWHEIAKSINEK